MYKLEEKIFFDEMRHAHGAVAYFSLCAGQSPDFALAMDMKPVIADINGRREFVKINSEHGFNQAADYLISHSELNAVNVISRDNADHFILDDNAIAAAFSAECCGLFKESAHSVNVAAAGSGAVLIDSPALFAGSWNFSFAAANNGGCEFKLVLNSETNIVITVNGMMNKGSAARLDDANAVRRFYVDAGIAVNKLNINLLNGHAGTGNDGRNAVNNFVFDNAIAGNNFPDGVSFFCHETYGKFRFPLFADNKNNIFEDITLRCANVST